MGARVGYEESVGVHPALEGYSRPAAQVKHVMGGGFKGLLYGAGTGAAVLGTAAAALGGGAVIMGGPFTMIPAALAAVFTPAAGWALSAVGSAAITGASIGGAIGATGGGLMALSNAEAAADATEDKLIAKFDQNEARKRRMEQLAMVRDQQQNAMNRQAAQMGLNPGHGLPQGRDVGGEGYSLPS